MSRYTVTLDDDLKSLWLKRVLSEKGVTATSLAKMLDINPASVRRWVRRDWKDSQRITGISKMAVIAICHVLELDDDPNDIWERINGA